MFYGLINLLGMMTLIYGIVSTSVLGVVLGAGMIGFADSGRGL